MSDNSRSFTQNMNRTLLALRLSEIFTRRRIEWLIALSVTLPVVLFVIYIAIDVSYYGRHIQIEGLERDYMTAWLVAIICGVAILLAPIKDKYLLYSYWWTKVFVALVFMLFYESNYVILDAYEYIKFDPTDTITLTMGMNTALIGGIASTFYKWTGGSYHAAKVLFGFMSLWAVYFLWRASDAYLGRKDLKMYALLSIYPTILFWSTIIGKESVAILALAVFLYAYISGYYEGHFSTLNKALLMLGIVASYMVRKWYILFLLSMLVVGLWKRMGKMMKVSVFISLVLAAFIFVYSPLMITGDPMSEIEEFSEDFAGDGGSTRHLDIDFSSPKSIAMYIPWGAFTAIYRPLPFDINNAFSLLAALENCFLLFLTYRAFRSMRKRHWRDPMILSMITYIFIWGGIYAIPSSLNLGTAVRYKLGCLPVLLLLLWGLWKGYADDHGTNRDMEVQGGLQ